MVMFPNDYLEKKYHRNVRVFFISDNPKYKMDGDE